MKSYLPDGLKPITPGRGSSAIAAERLKRHGCVVVSIQGTDGRARDTAALVARRGAKLANVRVSVNVDWSNMVIRAFSEDWHLER